MNREMISQFQAKPCCMSRATIFNGLFLKPYFPLNDKCIEPRADRVCPAGQIDAHELRNTVIGKGIPENPEIQTASFLSGESDSRP